MITWENFQTFAIGSLGALVPVALAWIAVRPKLAELKMQEHNQENAQEKDLFDRYEKIANRAEEELSVMRAEVDRERAHSARQDVAIKALQIRDTQCQDDLHNLRTRMTRYEQLITQKGLDFGPSV